jgi:hypothetical protein
MGGESFHKGSIKWGDFDALYQVAIKRLQLGMTRRVAAAA